MPINFKIGNKKPGQSDEEYLWQYIDERYQKWDLDKQYNIEYVRKKGNGNSYPESILTYPKSKINITLATKLKDIIRDRDGSFVYPKANVVRTPVSEKILGDDFSLRITKEEEQEGT